MRPNICGVCKHQSNNYVSFNKKMELTKEENTTKGRIFAKDGEIKVGEMTYSVADDFIIVDHTEVSDAYKGQGIVAKLFWELVEMLRKEDRKVMPLCPFTRAMFEKNPETFDVLRHGSL